MWVVWRGAARRCSDVDPIELAAQGKVAHQAVINRRRAAIDRHLAAQNRASPAAGSGEPQFGEASDNPERAARNRQDDRLERTNQIARRYQP